MKTKFNVILTLLLVFIVQLSFAQEKTISGTVSDDSGLPLPGVNIIIRGTTTGTQSDFDGNYSIEASVGQTLLYSYVGFATQEIAVGTSNNINVTMQAGAALEEVVVTALGISREKRSLGYATQEVSGETLSSVPVSNFADALSGEVSGLDIKSSGSMGGSTNIIIRGFNSLLGDNQALIVVDGTPVNNSTYNTSDQRTGRGGFDYGNAASDINPNDIESLNVLKGAAATALYGSRGQNGVIMITTKKGKKSSGIGVEVNSSVTVGTADRETLPRYQKQYGQGYDAEGSFAANPYFDNYQYGGGMASQYGADASYGAPFDPNLMVYQWNAAYPLMSSFGVQTPWIAAENDPNSVWNTSVTYLNSASFSGGNENGTFKFGFTNFLQEGNLANSKLTRNTIDFSGGYNLTEDFKVTTNVIFTNNRGRGRV